MSFSRYVTSRTRRYHKPAPEVKCGKRVRSKKQAVGSSGEKPSLPSERYPRDEEAQGQSDRRSASDGGEKLRHHLATILVKAEVFIYSVLAVLFCRCPSPRSPMPPDALGGTASPGPSPTRHSGP